MLESAKVGLSGAHAGASSAAKELASIDIEQGPALLRFLAIFAALGSFGCAAWRLFNIFSAFVHPVMSILYIYIAFFALTTILFEAKHEWIEKVGVLDKYQNMLVERCNFLTVMGGRGLFYFFQATLWLTFANSFAEIIEIVAASALAFVGILHLFAHWEIMPSHLAKKFVEAKNRAVPEIEKLVNKDLNKDGKIGA
mmetsp:Transcript_19736/g.56500  ORF Transcript_19736/g.56500 Transcript_19736/m.56500 type:complete len:197 (+) Transcript_19736:150-740(+)